MTGTGSATHIAFDTLNDYADGVLSATARRDVDRHTAECAECAARLDALRRVLAAAAALPRSIAPAEDDWPDLRRELERRKEVVLPTALAGSIVREAAGRTTGSMGGRQRTAAWRRWGGLAAAAIVLVVASSAVTWLVVRRNVVGEIARAEEGRRTTPDAARGAAVALPAGFRVTEDDYLRTIAELRAAVESQRHTLSPETVATVERSLDIVDDAIDEARDALIRDPRNQALVDLLSANYQRKLELLRRASELPARS